ncbi:FUN14 family-domain-containing protein, partial [Collybia nuda]
MQLYTAHHHIMLLPFFACPIRQLAGFRAPITRSRLTFSVAISPCSRLHSSASRMTLKKHVPWLWTGRNSRKEPIVPGFLKVTTGIAGIGLGIFSSEPRLHCDTPPIQNPNKQSPEFPSPPTSTVSFYELSFGTVTGFCAGIFVKKGIKAVAWFLGGIFVLLQYLGSESLVRVDWGRMATRFERIFYTTDASGVTQKPSVTSLWAWIVDFLTADFQPRASFIAGLALGLRV